MSSDKQQFNQAMEKWQQLIADEYVSVPVSEGITAIISSYFTDEPPDTQTGMTELEAFRTEATQLASIVEERGGTAELALDASRVDITNLIQDEKISDMIIIGNGSLSNLLLGERDYYDWGDVSLATNHLKQGFFIQRQCGGLTRALNVPMGLFAVYDQRNVHAALDPAFYPRTLEDPVNALVKPVFPTGEASYVSIKALRYARETASRDIVNKQLLGRFLAVEAMMEGAATDSQQFYIHMVKERFGFDLMRFCCQNTELHSQICELYSRGETIDDSQLVGLLQRAYELIDAQILNAPFLLEDY